MVCKTVGCLSTRRHYKKMSGGGSDRPEGASGSKDQDSASLGSIEIAPIASASESSTVPRTGTAEEITGASARDTGSH